MNSVSTTQDSAIGVLDAIGAMPTIRREDAAWSNLFLGMRTVRELLFLAVKHSKEKRSLLRAIATVIANHTSCVVAIYFERDSYKQLTPGACLHGDIMSFSDKCKNELMIRAETTCQKGHSSFERLNADTGLFALSVPVSVTSAQPEVLTVIIAEADGSDPQLFGVTELATASITLWHVQQEANLAKSESQSTAALQELFEKLKASPDLDTACTTLLDELQRYLECQRMALALRPHQGGHVRLQAISGAENFDKHSPLVSAIEAALDEAILRDTLTVWPPLTPGDRHASLAHHKLCGVADTPCVVSSPLRNAKGEAIGAWLFLGERKSFENSNVLNFIRAAEPGVTSCLTLLQRASEGVVTKLRQSMIPKKLSWKGRSVLVAICAVIVILFIPIQYKIGCDCVLEPVSRRFVAAPYDGILRKALVSSGATVHRGEVLARMDDREIRWELTSAMAERDRAAKQSDAAFANHKFAAAEVAKLERERFDLTIKILKQRQENLEVRSPIGGVVTAGDLEKAEGAPVTCGQTLFEIAPLTDMVVEIAIPEGEVPYVEKGQKVKIHFESYPNVSYEAEIAKVRPRSEIRDHQNVFIAEVVLSNIEGNLRPGMNGQAKVFGPRSSLGWVLFHKPWEALCMMTGW